MKFTSTAILIFLSGATFVPSFARLSSSASYEHGDHDNNNVQGDVHVARIALGFRHSCAIDDLAKLWCWGSNNSGELGDGTRDAKNNPTMISLGGDSTHANQVSLGYHHSCVITNRKRNNVKCWGRNWEGQVGDGTNENRYTPTNVRLRDSRSYATQISSGRSHSCVLTNLNVLKCWGRNYEGQIGNGTYGIQNKPIIVSLGNENGTTTTTKSTARTYATQIALGGLNTCVIDNLNKLLCWGDNTFGTLGDGTNVHSRNTPTFISLGDDDAYATQLALGELHSCIIDSNNNLKCWGLNSFGQLGDGTKKDKNVPTIIPFGYDDGSYATEIALGWWHSCALDNLKNLKCWGSGGAGALGNGTYGNKLTPTITALGYGNGGKVYATTMELGEAHSCAIVSDNSDSDLGGLMCWGGNSNGQLGDGTNITKNTPTSISIPSAQVFFVEGRIEKELEE